MSDYEVTITRSGPNAEEAVYVLNRDSHNAEAVGAALEALRTFDSHGHGRFPYGDNDLTIRVCKLSADEDSP